MTAGRIPPASNPAGRGRFAPSPTGPLHFGSLVAAVASYLHARSHDAEWLVRIEDIDPPREMPGASERILRSLDAHGFEYPPPLYQSTRLERYSEIIAELLAAGRAFRCACTRRQLRATARPGAAGLIYPGTCRELDLRDPATAPTVRLITTDVPVGFDDALQGPQRCRPASELGDFPLRRGDGLVAYQLAVAVDDHEQGITEVVRGTDLLQSTFMQLGVFGALGWNPPAYVHFPVVADAAGVKLAKQTGAPAIDDADARGNLFRALGFLRQSPPEELIRQDINSLWQWARNHWNPEPLRGLRQLPERSMMKS